MQYGQFLSWCLYGDAALYYKDFRWEGWQKDVSELHLSDGICFYPFLWTEADGIESRKRSITPMKEIVGLEFDFLRQLSQ